MDRINETHWEKLGSVRPKGEKLLARIPLPAKSDRLYCAIDSDGLRHLVISLNETDLDFEDTYSRGLRVSTRYLGLKGKELSRYVDVACMEKSGHIILNSIGDDILNELKDSLTDTSTIVKRVLAKWRSFWGKVPQNTLSISEQMGLLAEVYFLRNWIIPKYGIDAVSSWKGAWGSTHDFLLSGGSIEVKSTSSMQGRIFHISGLDQLTLPTGGSLYLFGLRLRQDSSSGITLPNEVEECEKLFFQDFDAVEYFEEGLARAGYSPLYRDAYSAIRWAIDEEALFVVNDEFPRLHIKAIKDGLPAGVDNIEYSINLNAFDHLIEARNNTQFKDSARFALQ